jgi:hypothetical protein
MKITPKKIFQFIEGNLKLLGDQLHLLPKHEREQVLYRSMICKEDCMKFEYCKYCGCSVPGKLYVKESCNGGERFPDMMGKEEWEQFKIKNNLEIHGDLFH